MGNVGPEETQAGIKISGRNINNLSYAGRRQWHPTPVLLPGRSHGRRSLVGCSPWGRKESDTTERLHFHFSLSCIGEGNGSPLQCSCLRIPGKGEPGGLPSMGSHRVGHDWSDLAAEPRQTVFKQLQPLGRWRPGYISWQVTSPCPGIPWCQLSPRSPHFVPGFSPHVDSAGCWELTLERWLLPSMMSFVTMALAFWLALAISPMEW